MLLTLLDGVQLNAEVTGMGQPLVLLHGFTGSAANWREIVDALALKFKVVTPDFLGHGRSDSPFDPDRYRMEGCVENLRFVFDSLDLTSVHLLGYSMGGRVALSFAVTYPEYVQTLILESASPGLLEGDERAARVASDDKLARMIETDGLESFVRYWEEQPLFASQARLPESVRARVRDARLRNNPVGLANSLRGLGTGSQTENWSRLSTIKIPSLILSGSLDQKFSEIGQRMATMIPNAKLVTVPDAGHTIHLEQPAEFVRLVSDFINPERKYDHAS